MEARVDEVVRVVLGIEPPELAVEVMDFLDRTGRARVVAAVGDGPSLHRVVRREGPDAVVALPSIVGAGAAALDGSSYLAVDTRESVRSLREAIGAGARGYFVWPDDREALAAAAARLMPARARAAGERRAAPIAVLGARGGAGATFLATHLAQALAREGRRVVLVDGEPLFGDLTPALGAPFDPAPRTAADLVPVIDELTPRHLEEALWTHPAGFRALLAPPEPGLAAALGPQEYGAVLVGLAGLADVLVVHAGRCLDDRSRALLERADRIAIVLTLDVGAFRGARRALEVLAAHGLEERCDLVVNRYARGEIVPRDVEAALGRPAAAVIRRDRGAARAQDHGSLLPVRGATGRSVARLASRLVERSGGGE
ncbi:MAG: hypothetical protein HY658_04350 [Actinobacteria bacterium]|nr:hypothetical protein [Actinomycetota bacterium]